MSKVRIAIIGNGMVGHRFIEELLDKAPAGQFDITVFCEEPPTTASTCRLISPITLRKNCRWYAKVSMRNTASRCWSANGRSPSTARRK